MSEFWKKLIAVQTTLVAKKSQYNAFGKYHYRNCEDILEAVKPLLSQQGLVLFISDTIELVGNRYYVKATATITDGETSHSVSALAREEENKKGQDSSQTTGSTSSYARKYALNGLFLIDDAKDADFGEYREQANKVVKQEMKQSVNDGKVNEFLSQVNQIATAQDLDSYKKWFFKNNPTNSFNESQLETIKTAYTNRLKTVSGE